jgi:cobalt-zinc-cadmium efflux system membrane fusion protein
MSKYLSLLILGLFFWACSQDRKEDAPKEEMALPDKVKLTEAQLKNAKIETGPLKEQKISSLLKVSGTIDVPPKNVVSISIPLGGYLKSTNLLPGMHVKKGENLAIMEDPQYINLQQEFLSTRTRLEFAENEFKRQKDLNQTKAVSDKAFQEAQMHFLNEKILLRSLSEKLRLIGIEPNRLNESNLSRSIQIPSPIDGYVSAVNVNIGKYTNPSDVLFELVNPSDIHLNLHIFEKDLDKLFIGQKLMAWTNTRPDKKYPCTIILIGKNLSEERFSEVHCHFEAYDKSLVPGMFMNAELEIGEATAYTIPTEAIVRFEGQEYVFAKGENQDFDRIPVESGNSENGMTQLRFGPNQKVEGRQFVLKGAYQLLMKMKNVEEEE